MDSARALLSTLITSEAAVLAIVVSLSLVAVQLAASSYSARMIEVFRRTPDLWILIGVYGVAMFYGLGVLKLIERANPQVNSLSNLEGHIALSYYLGVFAFVALVPYIWNTLDLLKPSTVINMLAKRITKQNMLSAIGNGQEKLDDKDPIQPIIDIVRGSLMKYDYETVKDGLSAIRDRTNIIFKNSIFSKEEEVKVSEHVFSHLANIGILAASRDDNDCTLKVIIDLHKIGMITVEQDLDSATWRVVYSLGTVGTVAAKQKLEGTGRAVIGLRYIGIVAAEHKLDMAVEHVVYKIGDIGEVAAKNKIKGAT